MAPTPPPYMGPSIATQIILNSRFVEEFNVIHIDTADRRPLRYLGKLDVANVYLALKHYCLLFHKLMFNKVDLVYIPISQTAIGFLRDVPLIVLSKLFKKKVILHLRGGYFREFYNSSSRIMKYIIRNNLAKIDRMIVLGQCLKPLFDGLIPDEKLSVVPNGAALPSYIHKHDSRHNKYITVLFLSSLIKSKGLMDVLYSVKRVIQRNNNVKYIFAGPWMKDEDRVACEDYLKKERVRDYVEFTGIIVDRQKMEKFQQADIFVFPTYYPFEGHPWVILEAMASGLPIITTDHGCIKESVLDGENGLIIPKRNAEAIAENIIYLIEHPDVRERMRQKSRELYESNFTKEHFVQRMIDVINLTMNSR